MPAPNPTVKFQPQLANVAGAPQTIATIASAAALVPRVFMGQGAPTAATLPAGPQLNNPMYVAAVAGQTLADIYVDTQGLALYVCTQSGTNATSKWQQIGGGGSGVMTAWKITAIAASYLLCSLSNGQQANTYIYKPSELSGTLAGEVIGGHQVNYSNWTNNYNQRQAQDTVTLNTETQIITPAYNVGATIFAMQLSDPGQGDNTFWVEISPSRQWAGVN